MENKKGYEARKIIKDAWHFGIAFTSACRVYRRKPEDEMLELIWRIYERFLPYIDNVSVLCAARDFQPIITAIPQDTVTIPNAHEKRFYELRERVMAEYLNRTIQEEGLSYRKIGEAMQCISDIFPPVGVFETADQFERWAEAHIGDAVRCCVKEHDEVPLPEDAVEDFNLLCLLMVRYSVGRHTHMPDTAAEFVMNNIEHINSHTAEKMIEAVAGQGNDGWYQMRKALKDVIQQEKQNA